MMHMQARLCRIPCPQALHATQPSLHMHMTHHLELHATKVAWVFWEYALRQQNCILFKNASKPILLTQVLIRQCCSIAAPHSHPVRC